MALASQPQWSPVMKTGNTLICGSVRSRSELPQWSPVMKTGNTEGRHRAGPQKRGASMEPGHEDREYSGRRGHRPQRVRPQWSPVMKTGNTAS